MFLPLLTIPIALPGDESKGNPDKAVDCKINPANIDCYHTGYDWGTIIYMKSGQPFMSTLSMEDLESALKKYWEQIGKDMRNKPKLFQ
jgi:hypothetical protein